MLIDKHCSDRRLFTQLSLVCLGFAKGDDGEVQELLSGVNIRGPPIAEAHIYYRIVYFSGWKWWTGGPF